MGKPSRVKKLELKAKRAATNEVIAAPVPNENTRRAVKDIFRDAKNNRSHGSGSSGGFIPSAKHVDGGMERYGSNAAGHRNNRPSLCIEGTERYDNTGPAANRPLDRYRAPSLRTRVDPVRPEITPDYGRVGRGAPAVKARVDRVDEAIARKNAYARRGDYAGEGPALLPLPPIETIRAYPRPEKVAVTYVIQGDSIVELDGYRVEPRVFRVDPLRGRRYTRVRLGAAGHMGPVTSVTRVLPPVRRVRYHPGYDTSAWTRVQGAEELVYRALVML